jgi:hypothetical protein
MTDFAGLLLNTGIPHHFSYHLPTVLAQSSSEGSSAAAAGINAGAIAFRLIYSIAIYVFGGFCGQIILKKLDYENSWLAWVPFASTYAYLEAGEQEEPLIWTIVAAIPCVQLIALIKVIPAWINICNALGKPPLILLTIFICFIGPFITFGYLAFA